MVGGIRHTAIAAITVALSCVKVPASDSAEPIVVRVESVSYTDAPLGRLTVAVAIANSSARKVYVLTTGGTALERIERLKDGAWVTLRAVKPATLGQVDSVAPGASHRDVAVLNLLRGTIPTLPMNDVPGTYRAIYLVFASWHPDVVGGSPGELLPEAERTSELFAVRPPEPERP